MEWRGARQPRPPAGTVPPIVHAPRWLWLVVLSVGLGLFEIIRQVVITTNNPNLVPSLILLGAVVMPATVVTFISGLRLSFDVGAGTLMAVAFVGGVVGVVTASLLEYQTLRHLGTLPTIAVAVVEESTKLLAPLTVLRFTRHRRPADGLLIGVACGAGFAAMETMGYAAVALLQTHRNLTAVATLLLQRGFFSPATHMAWTGITAAALWHAANQQWKPRSLALAAGSVATAVTLHATWDSTTSPPLYILVAASSLTLLAVTTRRLQKETDPSPMERTQTAKDATGPPRTAAPRPAGTANLAPPTSWSSV